MSKSSSRDASPERRSYLAVLKNNERARETDAQQKRKLLGTVKTNRKVRAKLSAKFAHYLFKYFCDNSEEFNINFYPAGVTFSFMNSLHTTLIHVILKKSLLPEFLCNVPCLIGVQSKRAVKLFSFIPKTSSVTLFHDPESPKHQMIYHFEEVIKEDEKRSRDSESKVRTQRRTGQFPMPIITIESLNLEVPEPPEAPISFTLRAATFFSSLETMIKQEIPNFLLTVGNSSMRIFVEQTLDTSGVDLLFEESEQGPLFNGAGETRSETFAVKLVYAHRKIASLSEYITISLVRDFPLSLKAELDYGDIEVWIAPQIPDG